MDPAGIARVKFQFLANWRLSTTLETSFCMEALESALHKSKPGIINRDQGCQFASEEWISFLKPKRF